MLHGCHRKNLSPLQVIREPNRINLTSKPPNLSKFSQRRDSLKTTVLVSETRCTTELKVGVLLLCHSSSCPYSAITRETWFQVHCKCCCIHKHGHHLFFPKGKKMAASLTPSSHYAGKSTHLTRGENDCFACSALPHVIWMLAPSSFGHCLHLYPKRSPNRVAALHVLTNQEYMLEPVAKELLRI